MLYPSKVDLAIPGVTIFSSESRRACLVDVAKPTSWLNASVRSRKSYFSSPESFFLVPEVLELPLDTQRRAGQELSRFLRNSGDLLDVYIKAKREEVWIKVGGVEYETADYVNDVLIKCQYRLPVPLDRDSWTECEGYPAWLIGLGNGEYTPEPNDDMASLPWQQWGQSYAGVVITRFEGDALLGFTDRTGNAALLYQEYGRTGTFVRGTGGSPVRDDHILSSERFGDIEVVPDDIMSLGEALSIARSYLASGSLPRSA